VHNNGHQLGLIRYVTSYPLSEDLSQLSNVTTLNIITAAIIIIHVL